MKRNKSAAVALALFSLILVPAFARADADATIKGKSAPVQLTVPEGWSKTEPGAEAADAVQIEAINHDDDFGAMVLFETIDGQKMSVDDYGNRVIEQMSTKLTESSHTDWEKTKIDGHDALQCELLGVRKNLTLAYLVTVVKTNDSYDQILVWSRKSKFDNAKPVFVKLTATFKQTGPAPAAPHGPQTIKGKDGQIELTVPDGWVGSKPKNKASQLLAINPKLDRYAQVISESRQDVTLDMQEYADFARTNMAKVATDSSNSDWETVQINGNNALRSDVHLTLKGGVKVAYVLTVIQTADHYHQVLAWSVEDAFEKAKPDLTKIADGLKELKPAH